MRRVLLLLCLLAMLVIPVKAVEYTAPEAPDEALELMPAEKESFAEGLWQVILAASRQLQPKFAQACKACVALVAIVMLVSLLRGISEKPGKPLELVAALGIAGVLLGRSDILIHLGTETVESLSQYGKLLLPVLTAALASQGGGTTSAALYTGTVIFDTFLTSLVVKILIPMVYGFLALAIANAMTSEGILGKFRDLTKWLMTWVLKIVLYIFTGYMAITGVVSGSADAVAMKATKLTISGMVPVVGGILSDASEAVIVGAGVMKSAVGVYGLLAVIAIWISPFLEIGIQYLLLKLTAALCATFGIKKASELIEDFSAAMGFVLAMTATVCFLLLISTVCFMKGVG